MMFAYIINRSIQSMMDDNKHSHECINDQDGHICHNCPPDEPDDWNCANVSWNHAHEIHWRHFLS